jgi:hypothetical protein
MDMSDIAFLAALEWIYDKVDDRFGKLAAWLVMLGLATIVIGLVVAALIYVLR